MATNQLKPSQLRTCTDKAPNKIPTLIHASQHEAYTKTLQMNQTLQYEAYR